jgi:hypothetical protein
LIALAMSCPSFCGRSGSPCFHQRACCITREIKKPHLQSKAGFYHSLKAPHLVYSGWLDRDRQDIVYFVMDWGNDVKELS